MLEAWSRCPQWATTVLQQLSGTTRPPASPERIHSLSRQSWELLLPQQWNCRGTGRAECPPHLPCGGTPAEAPGRPEPPTNLLLQLVHCAGHTLVARLVVLLGHGALQVLLELRV